MKMFKNHDKGKSRRLIGTNYKKSLIFNQALSANNLTQVCVIDWLRAIH